MPDVYAIDGVARRYAWGSSTAIPTLLGAAPDGNPVAELWFGAHPDSPSPVAATTLDALIATDPERLLGADVHARFGDTLPFLIKILAAERPLSIQVHPDRMQAAAGFAREDAAGLARDAPERTYRDPNHKPELLVALTDFDALCGFRPVERTIALLDHLAVAELAGTRDLLCGPDGLRAAFTHLLTLADPAALVAAVSERVAKADREPDEFAGAVRAARIAAEHFPGDPGVLVTLLLNDVRLRPGEAIYIGAGNVHAYLRGTGVEVMAASDNVVRAGLTPKHVDVAELLAITDFTPVGDPRWPAEDSGAGTAEFRPPAEDFALLCIDVEAFRKPGRAAGSCAVGVRAPAVVVCASGAIGVQVGSDALELSPGRAAFVPAREAAFTLAGSGQAFVATVGSPH
jgi:mannose-6-phosphate isomerase